MGPKAVGRSLNSGRARARAVGGAKVGGGGDLRREVARKSGRSRPCGKNTRTEKEELAKCQVSRLGRKPCGGVLEGGQRQHLSTKEETV